MQPKQEKHYHSAYCSGDDLTCGCGIHGYLRGLLRNGLSFDEALKKAREQYDKVISEGRASPWR